MMLAAFVKVNSVTLADILHELENEMVELQNKFKTITPKTNYSTYFRSSTCKSPHDTIELPLLPYYYNFKDKTKTKSAIKKFENCVKNHVLEPTEASTMPRQQFPLQINIGIRVTTSSTNDYSCFLCIDAPFLQHHDNVIMASNNLKQKDKLDRFLLPKRYKYKLPSFDYVAGFDQVSKIFTALWKNWGIHYKIKERTNKQKEQSTNMQRDTIMYARKLLYCVHKINTKHAKTLGGFPKLPTADYGFLNIDTGIISPWVKHYCKKQNLSLSAIDLNYPYIMKTNEIVFAKTNLPVNVVNKCLETINKTLNNRPAKENGIIYPTIIADQPNSTEKENKQRILSTLNKTTSNHVPIMFIRQTQSHVTYGYKLNDTIQIFDSNQYYETFKAQQALYEGSCGLHCLFRVAMMKEHGVEAATYMYDNKKTRQAMVDYLIIIYRLVPRLRAQYAGK